jgi:hypothetical protein
MNKDRLILFITLLLGFLSAIVMTVAGAILNPLFLSGAACALVGLLTSQKHARDKKRFLILGAVLVLLGMVQHFASAY